jgi:hypothetical protein
VKTRLPFIDAQYPFADTGVIERTIQTHGRQSNGIALFRYTSAFSHSLGGKPTLGCQTRIDTVCAERGH